MKYSRDPLGKFDPLTLVGSKIFGPKKSILALVASTLIAMVPGSAVAQAGFQDLHDFGGSCTTLSNGTVGRDGFTPSVPASDASGNVFVVTSYGGLYGKGGLFELTTAGAYLDLHDFGGNITGSGGATIADGAAPTGCVVDSAGNVYGGTTGGGQFGGGILWEFTTAGAYQDLHDFGSTIQVSSGSTGPDGTVVGTPALDANGNLFGVCELGGANSNTSNPNGFGMVWEFSKTGVYEDLHDFGGTTVLSNGTSGADGSLPNGLNLAIDPDGNLYGVVSNAAGGLLYEITTTGEYLDLHDFGGTGDGNTPEYVMSDSGGNLFGTCYSGGANNYTNTSGIGPPLTVSPGTLWKLSATGAYSTLHSFGSYTNFFNNYVLTDGINPTGPITMDSLGNLFGTMNCKVWELSGQNYFQLQDLGTNIDPQEAPPTAGLIIDPSGNLFGVMPASNANHSGNNYGYLFRLGKNAAAYSLTLNSNPSGLFWDIISGTVQLSRTSTTDTIVNLTSNSANLVVPSTTTVPAGQVSATFPITTYGVLTVQTATVTASATGVSASASVALQPTKFTAMSLSTGYDTGTAPVTGTITLNAPAPLGGFVVNLTSTNPTAMSVPATFTVPAGESQAQFTVTTTPTTTDQTGKITATYGSTSFSALLKVEAVVLSSITITPTEAQGTTKFTATVNMTRPVPSGMVQVAITTNSPYAKPPDVVDIPAGVTSVSFGVPTSAAGATTTSTLRAKLGSTAVTVSFTVDKTVVPPVLTSLTVAPGEAAGGTTFSATATLNEPAPTGGTVVTLVTNSPFVSPPATVTVPAGATSVTFPVNTSTVAANVTVLLKATLGTSAKTDYFILDKTVVPPLLTSLTVSPSEGTGGDVFMATVTLNEVAPTGGTVVTLVTDSPFVSPPATVTVPAGQTTFTFPVNTSVVSKNVIVLLKATLGTSVKTFYFTLDP